MFLFWLLATSIVAHVSSNVVPSIPMWGHLGFWAVTLGVWVATRPA